MRMLGVDLGKKRIGIAVGESEPGVVSPRPFLTSRGSLQLDAEQVADRAKREEVDVVVIGLPLEPDGQEGKMASIMRKFGECVSRLGYQVRFADETLTSVQATATLAAADLTIDEARKRKDGEAACLILERFLADLERA